MFEGFQSLVQVLKLNSTTLGDKGLSKILDPIVASIRQEQNQQGTNEDIFK